MGLSSARLEAARGCLVYLFPLTTLISRASLISSIRFFISDSAARARVSPPYHPDPNPAAIMAAAVDKAEVIVSVKRDDARDAEECEGHRGPTRNATWYVQYACQVLPRNTPLPLVSSPPGCLPSCLCAPCAMRHAATALHFPGRSFPIGRLILRSPSRPTFVCRLHTTYHNVTAMVGVRRPEAARLDLTACACRACLGLPGGAWACLSGLPGGVRRAFGGGQNPLLVLSHEEKNRACLGVTWELPYTPTACPSATIKWMLLCWACFKA